MSTIIVPCSEGDTVIFLKVVDGDKEYIILMRKRDKLRDLMKKFWKGSCKRPHPALFTHQGKKIRARSTVASLGLVCGDTIQYQATGENPKEIFYEELVILADSCKQFSKGLMIIFHDMPVAWFESEDVEAQRVLLKHSVEELNDRMLDLKHLRHAPYNRVSYGCLTAAQLFLAEFMLEMFSVDDILSMSDVDHIPEASTSQSFGEEDDEICLVCHESVLQASASTTGANKQVSPDVVMVSCCHKFAHALCLAEWFVHSVYYQDYQTETCPHCRTAYPPSDAYPLHRKALFALASREPHEIEAGHWAAMWQEMETASPLRS
ncbi:hypothetical protein PV08_07609 [Exophiala spinifera]|uniref:RING-type domain-containing protein n=1 Tax=Exophiala spinifera TaxID=91928 RepID=A0A0D2BU69_9EURO|nr:uncharacterized protein PV08_07609 [Exophiala spinifera]KIW14824.1 hypothetical protein PV08_07609 [Exophiala spinifera]